MSYSVLLTSSNAKQDLAYTAQEFQDLNKWFALKNNVVKRIINSNVTEQALFYEYLGSPDIRLFHFSGHAGDGKLLLDDGRLSSGSILAAMMKEAKQLKLVFLNGCATHELVDAFLDNGAALVIATKVSVFDRIACSFSSFFYEGFCRDNMSVRNAFEYAKLKLRDMLKAPEAGNESAKEKNNYEIDILEFANSPARAIGKKSSKDGGVFQWEIYHKENSTDAEITKKEAWKLTEQVMQSNSLEHREPSFDFLKSLATNVIDIFKTLETKNTADPHLDTFKEIKRLDDSAQDWTDENTGELIQAIGKTLLMPLKKPFDELINFSNANQDFMGVPDEKAIRNLLAYQVALYKAFIRTAGSIMISDFLEALILVGGNDTLTKEFGKSVKNNPELCAYIKQILTGKKDLNDVEFAIDIMRGIVPTLADMKSKVKEVDRKKFQQFVEEYSGNTQGSEIEIAKINLVHEIMIAVIKKIDSSEIEQEQVASIRCYCDRVESALIELFQRHKYVLLYEIITVGRVEANRQRDKPSLKTIYHEIITNVASYATPEITYGEDFAENYSVLLVSHRNKYLPFLSLSPLVVNVAPFLDEERSMLFFYNGRKEDYIRYIDIADKDDSSFGINTTSLQDVIAKHNDTSFLHMNTNISKIYQKRSNKQINKARSRFAKVRDQWLYLENKFDELLNKA